MGKRSINYNFKMIRDRNADLEGHFADLSLILCLDSLLTVASAGEVSTKYKLFLCFLPHLQRDVVKFLWGFIVTADRGYGNAILI